MILYCSGTIYNYCSCLDFSPIKQNEKGKDIHNEIFNNVHHLIKNCLHVDFLQDDFVMYKDKVLIRKIEIIPIIADYIIPVDCFQKINS